MIAIILAGGFATRLWPLTEKTAKPLILVAGKPLISSIVESLPAEMRIIVSTNSVFADDFAQWKSRYFPGRDIEIFVEDSADEQGKKGALFATALVIRERNITEDVFLIAGDNYFGFSLSQFLEDFNQFSDAPLLAAYDIGDLERAKLFGVVVPYRSDAGKTSSPPNCIESFQEKPEYPLSTLVSTGCFVFPKGLLPDVVAFAQTSRDDLGKVFEHFLANGHRVRYFSFREKWFDIGSFSAYLEANTLLLNGKLVQEQNVRISEGAHVSGSVFLGKNVVLGENVVVENSTVLEGCTLQNCTVRNSVIGKNVVVSDVDIERKIIRDESVLMR